MDKPEDIPQDVWDKVCVIVPSYLDTSSYDMVRINMTRKDVARAILSAQSQAYIDAAKIARLKSGDAQDIANRLRDFFDEPGDSRRLALDAAMMIEYLNSDRISAAILQRKEEIGR